MWGLWRDVRHADRKATPRLFREHFEPYHPRTAEEFLHVSPVIENAVGRFVIRTRLEDGVAATPGEALAYLRAIPSARPSGADAAFEEAGTYGWGIGHPEEPVADLLARIATDDDVEFRVQHSILTLDAARFFLASAAGPDAGYDSGIPRYWDWRAACGDTFQWDPDVMMTRVACYHADRPQSGGRYGNCLHESL